MVSWLIWCVIWVTRCYEPVAEPLLNAWRGILGFNKKPNARASQLMTLEFNNLKISCDSGQPPRTWLLNEMSVATVGQDLCGRSHVDAKKAQPCSNREEFA